MNLLETTDPIGLLPRLSPYRWGRGSRSRLEQAHPDLRRLFEYVIVHPSCPFDLTIPKTGGLRTQAQQDGHVAAGVSGTRNSRHLNRGDGITRALDVVPFIDGRPRWHWGRMRQLAFHVFACSHDLGVAIEWGGNWDNPQDGAHYELPRTLYP